MNAYFCLSELFFTHFFQESLLHVIERLGEIYINLLGGTYELRELLVPVIKDGKSVYKSPSVMELRDYCKQEQNTLWDESRRFVNPQKVYVDLSQSLYDRWRLVNALTIFNYRNKELTEFVGSAKNLGLFPGVNRVEDHHSFFRIEFLICKADQIGLDLAGLLAVDTVYSLVARVGNLFCVFGKLDLWLEGISSSCALNARGF